MVGVEHFYLCNHLSVDGYETVLQPYIDQGIVELSHLTDPCTGERPFEIAHAKFYNDCIRQARGVADWLALLDSDEFIVPTVDADVPTVLDRFKDLAGVSILWQLYGAAGNVYLPPDKLLLESMTLKADPHKEKSHSVKNIVQPTRVVRVVDSHLMVPVDPFQVMLTDRTTCTRVTNRLIIDQLRLNHYNTGDINYYETIKVPFYTGYAPHLKWLKTRARNNFYCEVEDRIMDRFLPGLKERLSGSDGKLVCYRDANGSDKYSASIRVNREYQHLLPSAPWLEKIYELAKDAMHITCFGGGIVCWALLRGLLHNSENTKQIVVMGEEPFAEEGVSLHDATVQLGVNYSNSRSASTDLVVVAGCVVEQAQIPHTKRIVFVSDGYIRDYEQFYGVSEQHDCCTILAPVIPAK